MIEEKDLETLDLDNEGAFEIVNEDDIEDGDIVFSIMEDENGELQIEEYKEDEEE